MSVLSLMTLAYVGPGAGLGAAGALFAVLAAIVLGLVGLVLYPIQIFRKWLVSRKNSSSEKASAP
jgi:hypothetical protein